MINENQETNVCLFGDKTQIRLFSPNTILWNYLVATFINVHAKLNL